jgi:Asp-tRNA(Asn)/Glu-tRNA(Gln) amidotransferase A subunit family amidase
MTSDPPEGLLDAFWAYERALMDDDTAAMSVLFANESTTLRGDPGGLLVGHEMISDFRRVRGGAPKRAITDVHVQTIDEDAALIVAVTAPLRGGRGMQTQLWRRGETGWAITAAHVSPPPVTFDPTVWRVVGDPLVAPTGMGALDGETIAVKDLFAVAGFAVGGGVPQFLAEQSPNATHAPALARLLAAGASVRGIARTDQFAYSLDGDNPHYGTPVNAVVPGGIPGGSSNGSTTAVALGAATIGLATDTAGSVRVPASYQALWGLRTTHGSVPTDGLLPLAPDFDTVGLLARSSALLGRAADALLGDAPRSELGDTIAWEDVLPDLGDLAEIAETFRVHQAFQSWQIHGTWITAHEGAVIGSAGARFAAAAQITAEEDAVAQAALDVYRELLDSVLGNHVLVMPTTVGAAPRIWADAAELNTNRSATFLLTCLAAVSGRPVVNAPTDVTPAGPVGTSYLGPRFSDRVLIEFAARDTSA